MTKAAIGLILGVALIAGSKAIPIHKVQGPIHSIKNDNQVFK